MNCEDTQNGRVDNFSQVVRMVCGWSVDHVCGGTKSDS